MLAVWVPCCASSSGPPVPAITITSVTPSTTVVGLPGRQGYVVTGTGLTEGGWMSRFKSGGTWVNAPINATDDQNGTIGDLNFPSVGIYNLELQQPTSGEVFFTFPNAVTVTA